ncbi:MAG: hypothetical protein O2856_03045, partial [Planctomycetota bacterium]|nr:hypothetical protein [Planctomycetota bacterium]
MTANHTEWSFVVTELHPPDECQNFCKSGTTKYLTQNRAGYRRPVAMWNQTSQAFLQAGLLINFKHPKLEFKRVV